MPTHVVHDRVLSVMRCVFGQAKRKATPESRAAFDGDGMAAAWGGSTGDERLMLLQSCRRLEAYLMYRKPQRNLVVVDALYSPYSRQGHATNLLATLEARAGGKTVATLAPSGGAPFFAAKGYAATEGCAPPGHALMTKYIWDQL